MKENNYSKEIFIKSIKYLKGVGPKYAEILAKKNIITLYDLISFYPRTYDDRRKTLKIYEALQNQEKTSVVYVEVIDISSFTFQYRNKPLVIVTDGDVICEVPIYGGRLPAGIAKGAKLYLTGKFLRSGRGKIQCRVIEFEKPSSNSIKQILSRPFVYILLILELIRYFLKSIQKLGATKGLGFSFVVKFNL